MLWRVYNGAMQTTGSPAKVALVANTILSLLQIVPKSIPFKLKQLDISFDGSAAATPGVVELIETDVGATVTNYATADITRLDGDALALGDPTTNLIDISSTSKSGFTAAAEGTITSVRNLDGPWLIAPTNQFVIQIPLGDEAVVQVAKFARIRMKFPAAVNVLCALKFMA